MGGLDHADIASLPVLNRLVSVPILNIREACTNLPHRYKDGLKSLFPRFSFRSPGRTQYPLSELETPPRCSPP